MVVSFWEGNAVSLAKTGHEIDQPLESRTEGSEVGMSVGRLACGDDVLRDHPLVRDLATAVEAKDVEDHLLAVGRLDRKSVV
jgi:hypothetical protein